MLAGVAWVLLAATGLGLGSLAAGVAAATHVGPLATLLVRPLFLVGLAVDGIGFVAHVLALRSVPMAVAQGAVSASLAVTALGARTLLGTRLRARETVAVVVVCVGLGVLAAMSDGTGAVTRTTELEIGLAAATALLAVAGVASRLLAPAARGVALSTVSGLAFAACSVGIRVLDTVHVGAVLTDPLTVVLLAAALVGGLTWTAALRHAPVTSVTAIVVAAEVVPPSLLGPLVLGDEVGAAFGVVAPVVLAATVACGVVLARVTNHQTAPVDAPVLVPS